MKAVTLLLTEQEKYTENSIIYMILYTFNRLITLSQVLTAGTNEIYNYNADKHVL